MTKLLLVTFTLFALAALLGMAQNRSGKSNEDRIQALEEKVNRLELQVLQLRRADVELRPAR